ncbi:MAG: RDD family protein [Thermodesulfobacteriota bacterium]|nr:RDD family protein [Thermodesulfobacteriota bacterium]
MKNQKTNTLTIKTPEGVVFSLNLAGPITRFLAWVIDLSTIIALFTFVNILPKIIGIVSYDLASAFSVMIYFIVSIGYGITLEWYWKGQTIGKRVLQLRVMDEQGLRLQFSQIVVRNLLRFVDNLPIFYMVGGLACLISSRAQRLGDLAANTIVVWTPPISEPNLDHILSDKYNSFHEYPHLEARLRQRSSVQEANVALKAMFRRNELDPSERIQLFKEIAEYFRSVVKFPQGATDGLSDEQYIRNVVDVLFRKQKKYPGPHDHQV